MSSMNRTARVLAELLALALIVAGVFLMWVPAGLVVAGVALLVELSFGAVAEEEDPDAAS